MWRSHRTPVCCWFEPVAHLASSALYVEYPTGDRIAHYFDGTCDRTNRAAATELLFRGHRAGLLFHVYAGPEWTFVEGCPPFESVEPTTAGVVEAFQGMIEIATSQDTVLDLAKRLHSVVSGQESAEDLDGYRFLAEIALAC